jgi:hypothetical protein
VELYALPVLDIRWSFVAAPFKFADTSHLNAVGASEFGALVAARMTGKPLESPNYAASPRVVAGVADPALGHGTTSVVAKRRDDPSETLELRFSRGWQTRQFKPFAQIRLAVRLPDDTDAVVPARMMAGNRIPADTSALSLPRGDQILLVQMVYPNRKIGLGPGGFLSSYHWSGEKRTSEFYKETSARISARADSYLLIDPIRVTWSLIDTPSAKDWG